MQDTITLNGKYESKGGITSVKLEIFNYLRMIMDNGNGASSPRTFFRMG